MLSITIEFSDCCCQGMTKISFSIIPITLPSLMDYLNLV